jgi:zinc D-Ala-D-Ala carboxypeptidase
MRFLLYSIALLSLVSCSPSNSLATDAEKQQPPLVPDFSLTRDELALFAADISWKDTAERIMTRPAEFLLLMREILAQPEELFLIADKNRSLTRDYEPEDLVSLTEFPLTLNRKDLSLRALIMPDLLAMDQAARNEGLRLVYSSSYRSYEYQQQVYRRHVEQMGQEAADRISARPGTSQHQLGTTVDFGSITDAFAETDEGRWLADNAWRYGFSLSYPRGYEELTGYAWESWHYRYIGHPAARMTELYFGGIQHNFLYFLDTHRAFFKERQTP